MRWHDVLFLHWRVRPEVIRPLIPSILELDTFEDWCWIGVVIGVGNGFRRPRPPNRACSSPAHGSPVGGFLIGIGTPTHEP